MQRLTGLDAGFLYMETPTLHMHTLKVAVLDQPPGGAEAVLDQPPGGPEAVLDQPPGGAEAVLDQPSGERPGVVPIEFLREEIGRRLHRMPALRRRLVEVPLGLHHPVWIEDPDFDIEYHVRRAWVPPPGNRAEMDRVVSDIASRPLDRRRPLWEMHILEGLAGGQVGVVVKIHHAVADGVAAAAMLANVMTTDPDQEAMDEVDDWRPEEVPTNGQLVADALRDWVRALRLLPALVVRTLRNVVALLRHRRWAAVSPPRPMLDAPRTPFNASLTPHRSFASTTLSLAEVKEVKAAFDVSVNDVVLATVGGALRRYLAAQGELPGRSLIAGVPVSTDRPDDVVRLGGNKVSNMFTSLRTDEPDPVRRIMGIHEVTAEAKVVQNLLGVETMQDWVQYTPGRPYGFVVRLWSRFRVADQLPPPINAVVSNVPGPREPLFVGGARLAHLYSVGPILEGIGLNVTVWSYLDRLDVGVLACRETLPDPERVAAALHEALAELVAAARQHTAGVPAPVP